MTKIWIDTASGTWGEVDPLTPVIVDLAAHAEETGEDNILATLDEMSDREIQEFGIQYGKPVSP